MTNELDAIEDWVLLAQISQAYRVLTDAFMEQIGMHRAQAMVIYCLYLQDGLTQSEIAEQLSVQGASVTQVLQRMEEAGFVLRYRDPDDNRLVRVYLTDVGRQKERSINEQFMKLQEAVFAGMSDIERVLFRRMLKQVLQNMASKPS
jgi:MarR family transcriptional regulator, organic hydroperoxide resistance regulator